MAANEDNGQQFQDAQQFQHPDQESLNRFYAAASTAGFSQNLPVGFIAQAEADQVSSYIRSVPSPGREEPADPKPASQRLPTSVISAQTFAAANRVPQSPEVYQLYAPLDGNSGAWLGATAQPVYAAPHVPVGFSPHLPAGPTFLSPYPGMMPAAPQPLADPVAAYQMGFAQQQQHMSGLLSPYVGYAPPPGTVAYSQEKGPMGTVDPLQQANVLVDENKKKSTPVTKRSWCPCQTIFD